MQKMDYSKIIVGEPIKSIVRIKPPTNFQREDVKLIGNTISLTDANNRILEEFDVPEVYGPEFTISQIFDNVFRAYLTVFIQGFTVSFFAFGSTGSGKSQTIEGNRKEPGLITLMSDSIYNLLETKKHHANQARSSEIQNYSYGVRIRFVEIIDEEINDLLGKSSTTLTDTLQVREDIWEGPSIDHVTWLTTTNAGQLNEAILNATRNRNNTSNEFGKLSAKATAIFTIELLQTQELTSTRDNVVLISRMNFFDLPGSEIMLDDPETIRVRQGSTLNKSIIALSTLIKDLSKKGDFVQYDTSVVSRLMKDTLGGNSYSAAIFTIQNGDPKGSSLTLNYLKYSRSIQNYPIVNDSKAFGLLKKYRAEVAAAASSKFSGGSGAGDNNLSSLQAETSNQKLIDLEKKLIEQNLDKMRQADEKTRLASKITELREKYNQLLKDKSDLQGELIKSEEEKLEISKSLVEMQIENTRLMEIIQNEKYESNNKLLNAESDVLALNIREEKALKTVQELQDRLKELSEEKREIEIEFVALKKNYIQINQQLEEEKLKNQNIGMELINMVNENKALHDEINDIYKKSGSTSEENTLYLNKIEKLSAENQEQREALVFAKAEIERLKTELLKYDIMEQQHRLDLDNKKVEMEKGFIEITKEKQNELTKLNKDAEQNTKRIKDEKLLWESQKMELTHKNKLAQRKIAELEDKINEVMRGNEELGAENNKILLQLDEMRSIYRNKLIQLTTDQNRGPDKPVRVGYDLNAREELIRTYTEKEIELTERLEKERRNAKTTRQEMAALRQWSRQIKFLAEDWAPVGVPLPDILVKEPPTKLDDETMNPIQQDLQNEIDRLRKRNRKLEEELKVLQDNMLNQTQKRTVDEPDLQRRLLNEIDYLKGAPDQIRRPGSNSISVEQLRKERNELQEENRRLVNMLKDNKKWDIYLLQRDNERLMRAVKDYESGDSSAVGPTSGDSSSLKQKISYYEKMVKQLEKERSELMVRATMAEEQLKSLQEHLQKSTLDYQKKIMELKKANAKAGIN